MGSLVLAAASESCSGDYVWHDHYRNGYRLRHRHCVESLERHYQDDPLRTQQFHNPEAPEQSRKESPLELRLRLRIVPEPADEDNVVRSVI